MAQHTQNNKTHYLARALGAVLLLVAALYFTNLSIFNVWQSAFPENQPYLGLIEVRFWLFGLLALGFAAASVWLTVSTIRLSNRETGQTSEDKLLMSDAVCSALQLINFVQDIDLDFRENHRICSWQMFHKAQYRD